MADMPSRRNAYELLCEFNKTEKAIKHALAVEATMRHMAAKAGEDPELWGLVGLVHDLDYEQFPDQHCAKTVEILTGRGYPPEVVRAAASHGWPNWSDAQPTSLMEKTLFAVDELTGLVAACALVRPSKSVMDLETKSVKKKWKEKQFAAGVNRGVIEQGAQMLGVPLEDLIGDVIAAMRAKAPELGLAGTAQ